MENLKDKLANIDWIALGGKLIGAIAILIIGFWLVKLIIKSITKLMEIRKVDKSLQGFILSLLGALFKFAVVIAAAGFLGVDLTALAAILAAAGLAVGMALQGSLSNFAGGALIMFFKPFKVGDYIKAQGEEGFVKQIEIFTTKINTVDHKEVIIPNGALSNGNIVNFSSEDNRRVDLNFGVSYDANIKETKEVLLEVINSYPKVIKTPAPAVMVGELADSSVNFITRTWVKSADYWDAYFYIMEHTKIALDKAGIEIPYPHSVEIQKEG